LELSYVNLSDEDYEDGVSEGADTKKVVIQDFDTFKKQFNLK
jgi:hypothetical protein